MRFKGTLTQQLIWLDQNIFGNNQKYNIGGYVSLNGHSDVRALSEAITLVLASQEIYASEFQVADDELICVVQRQIKLPPLNNILDFSDQENPGSCAEKWMTEDFSRHIDILKDPLFEIRLIRISPTQLFWYTRIHHIISDGWSFMLLLNQVADAYAAICRGEHPVLPTFAYSEFAHEETVYRNSDLFLKDRAFWMNEFDAIPEQLFRHIDSRNTGHALSQSDTLHIDSERKEKLRKFAVDNKISVFQIMLGLILVYFGRTQAKKDISIGLPVLNRSKRKYRYTAGVFMNLICVPFSFDLGSTLLDIIRSIGHKMHSVLRHQQYQYGNIIKDLGVQNAETRLYSIKVSYEEFDFRSSLEGLEVSAHALSNHYEDDPLSIYIRDYHDQGLDIRLIYNTKYIDPEQLHAAKTGLDLLIDHIISNDASPAGQLPLVSSPAKEKILAFSNGPAQIWESGTFLELWERTVAMYPRNIAVVSEGRKISYDTLHQLSVRIAAKLNMIFNGKSNKIAAIYLPHSELTIIYMISCMMAGIPFMPIDPDNPEERILRMLHIAGCDVLLTDRPESRLSSACRQVNLQELLDTKEEALTFNTAPNPAETCYIMFTSGSTGAPKGVSISHLSLGNYINNFKYIFCLTEKDVVLQQSSYSFDTCMEEIFPILSVGGQLLMISQRKDIPGWLELLEQEKVSIISATPLILSFLNRHARITSLRLVISGGEPLKLEQVDNLLRQGIAVYNTYGPTETTVCATFHKVDAARDLIPIGRPMANYSIYVLDKEYQLLPLNVEGDLYIGGQGLALNYLHDDQLYTERFLSIPIHPEGKLYRTGDKGKMNEKGILEYMGRSDAQVKIMGVRIELTEIEQAIREYENCADAAVINSTDAGGNNCLLAFIVLRSPDPDHESHVRSHLGRLFPYYMIPRYIFGIPGIPMTIQGKVDASRLAAYASGFISAAPDMDGHHPADELETKLHDIWTVILKTPHIGVNNNFFHLGGDSLTATVLTNKINQEFLVQIKIADIFFNPTIRSLATLIKFIDEEMFTYVDID